MAIALQGSPTTAENAGNSVTGLVPGGTAAGEHLLAQVSAEMASAIPTQTGWTRIATSFEGTVSVALFIRQATTSEPASYTFSGLPLGGHSVQIARVSGIDPTNPLDAAGISFVTGGAATTITAPALSTVTASTVILYGLGVQSTGATRTLTPPAGVALVGKDDDATATGRRGFIFATSQPTAGSTPTRTFTCTASLPMAGVAVALRAASDAPTGPAAPTVNAGADTTLVSGETFSRTATENDNGSEITARSWTILSGPIGAGQVIGNSATLSFQVVTTGTYVVRYSATNAVGTSSDDVTATVTATSGGGTALTPSLLHAINGRATPTRFSAAVECGNTTSVRIQAATDTSFTTGLVTGSASSAVVRGGVGWAHPEVSGLAPLTDYFYRLGLADSNGVVTWTGQVGTFSTGSVNSMDHRLVFGSCLNGSSSSATVGMATRGADLAFITGDLYYRDGASQTVESFRGSVRTQVRAADLRNLLRNTPIFGYVPDDHDAHTNDGTYSSTPTGWTNWNAMHREMFATGSLPTGRGCYEAFSWKGVRYILLDTRSFATPGSTVLGATQKAWLYNELDNCPDRAIVIVQGSVWAGGLDAGEDGWLGTPVERNEIASRIKNCGTPAAIIAGDMHALAANDGSTSPGNVPVFQAAPLYNSTSHKGGPYTAGPYPGTGVTAQQYGQLDIAFTDTAVTYNFTGFSAPSTARITESVTFASAAPDPQPEPDPTDPTGADVQNLHLGLAQIVGIYIGSTPVLSVWLGSTQVWGADTSTPTQPTNPTPSPEQLTWAPPSGWETYPTRTVTASTSLTTISGSGDVRIILPSTVAAPITVSGFRNVVIMGGHIKAQPVSQLGGVDQRCIYATNISGILHIEGVLLDGNGRSGVGTEADAITVNGPNTIVQIQNVRAADFRGTQTGNHADIFQTWLGVKELRFDKLTGSSNYQGIKFELTNTFVIDKVTLRRVNLIGNDLTPTDGGGYYFWMEPAELQPIVFDQVWIRPRGTRPFGQSVWPGITNSTNAAVINGSGQATWPTRPQTSGVINNGIPPAGDFVPAGSVGVGYVSPGYVGDPVITEPTTTTTTGGAGGSFSDQMFVTHTDAAGTASTGHVFAAGLDWTRPVGLLVYCDGSGEFGLNNPTSSYLLAGANGLVAVAKKHNLLLVTPMAPGDELPDGGGVGWYMNSNDGTTVAQKIAWSRSIIDRTYELYNIDLTRVVLGGYSSGAQWLTEFFGPAHASQIMDDGVAVAISYGGSPKVTAQHTAAHKAAVPYVWDTGDQDPAWTDQASIYGVKAGYDWYTAAGFTTQLHLVAGEDHYRDGQFGAVMDREITEHVTPA
ncbi:alkaline phosphatase D family protein [Modestobacter sp. VKM Ac-2985]|uniref:alkaline phosphatase D family protein n=1 Tax=Modestobacter sp. VKM Ac-2985 TaxID=3004139 RepID=UPI0022AB7F26|nr:alkaline phosphatase D family protein [Modestobacter sp. VKM Ac-2985]MCZ2837126.1 alkaline phosphatase D family protein [Modestobacter sp. VKM Ac-2985]